MTIKKNITTAILAAIMTYSSPAKADFISGEVFGSNKGALLEVKGSASIGDQPNVQYFTRIRRFRSYDDKNTSFMQNELSLGTIAGFRLLAQARLALDAKEPGALSKIAKLKPYVAQKALAAAARFNRPELENLYNELSQTHLALRRSPLPARTLMERFVIKFAAGV